VNEAGKSKFTAPVFERGTVCLVGAGPGDPGLLTLHAFQAIQQADIIVYDALVSQQVLDLIPSGARLEYAGKRGGRPSHNQKDIILKLIQLAHEGNRVLRLKGGDPFVFGRGGEEAKGLAEAGIKFRIIPGITAGLGGLAYAGIPATSRETNQALVFVTGHAAVDGPDLLDWGIIGRMGQPIVIYMGLTHLCGIIEHLLEGGLHPDTPLAILTQATLPEQSIFETTLGEAVTAIERHTLGSPALTVIGNIVGLRHALLPYLLGHYT
jgi:uroporphyrin-III C-methyltransferase